MYLLYNNQANASLLCLNNFPSSEEPVDFGFTLKSDLQVIGNISNVEEIVLYLPETLSFLCASASASLQCTSCRERADIDTSQPSLTAVGLGLPSFPLDEMQNDVLDHKHGDQCRNTICNTITTLILCKEMSDSKSLFFLDCDSPNALAICGDS